jgi:hypothetical protein
MIHYSSSNYISHPYRSTTGPTLPTDLRASLTLIILLIIPIQSVMLDLWTRGIQNPVEYNLDILNQVAREFDVSDISRVVLRPNIVMLQYARCVEIMDEGCSRLVTRVGLICSMVIQDGVLKILGRVEIFVYADHLGVKPGRRLLVGITHGSETFPE